MNQNKKTKQKIGQLFDHGCDSLNVTITSLTFTVILGLNFEMATYFIVSSLLVFFFATWDEYFTKEMYLAPINGADEGLVALEMCMLLAGIFPTLFHTQIGML